MEPVNCYTHFENAAVGIQNECINYSRFTANDVYTSCIYLIYIYYFLYVQLQKYSVIQTKII